MSTNEMSNIVDIRTKQGYSTTRTSGGADERMYATYGSDVKVMSYTNEVTGSSTTTLPEDIHSGLAILKPALALLDQSANHLQEAINAIQQGDRVTADLETMYVHGLLPELFCCRKLGDGFGSVISALLSALSNNKGMPLTENQLRIVRSALVFIRKEPFASFEQTIDIVDAMESSGFEITSGMLNHLEEELSE